MRVQNAGSDADPSQAALARLVASDALGQLWRREGEMARLGSEGDALKLDWVAAVPWLLAHPEALAEVERQARAMLVRGVRHVIWAGMGGSVLTVRTLHGLGYCDASPLTIHPLDSTDPAALNAIVRALAQAKGLSLPADGDLLAQPDLLRALLDDVALVAVAMGMTSEEPISHLAWLAAALGAADLPLPDHLIAMALPGSYLDTFAAERNIPRLPLQPDGGSGTGGRMSAPGTRVFLLPVALWLATSPPSPLSHEERGSSGGLAEILRLAWASYGFDAALADPAGNRFVRLAAALAGASIRGAVRLTLTAPGKWNLARDWAEQLFEESLGKGGKGVMVFAEEGRKLAVETAPGWPAGREVRLRGLDSSGGQSELAQARGSVDGTGEVWLRIVGQRTAADAADAPDAADAAGVITLREPLITSADSREQLAGLAALFLGLQLSMALYGYLHSIPYAGQPAVEDYKARARALRDSSANPLPARTAANSVSAGRWTLFAPAEMLTAASDRTPRAVLQAALRRLPALEPLPYLDITINGEAPVAALVRLHTSVRTLAVGRLGALYKLRRAPAAYHSTEQSEMDGPPALLSLRALALRHEPSLLGDYTPRFLIAQAVATWQAMIGVGRACLLLLYDGDTAEMAEALAALLDEVGEEADG